eukprot:13876181-Alexandrium_andersonii.AAC.1
MGAHGSPGGQAVVGAALSPEGALRPVAAVQEVPTPGRKRGWLRLAAGAHVDLAAGDRSPGARSA